MAAHNHGTSSLLEQIRKTDEIRGASRITIYSNRRRARNPTSPCSAFADVDKRRTGYAILHQAIRSAGKPIHSCWRAFIYDCQTFGPVAQLAEQQTLNLWVVGSIPTR